MSIWHDMRSVVWARALEGDLSAAELLILLRLVEHLPNPFPSLASLCAYTRLSERTVRRAVRRLEQRKLIAVGRNPGRGNTYAFLDELGRPMQFSRLGPPPWPGHGGAHPARRGGHSAAPTGHSGSVAEDPGQTPAILAPPPGELTGVTAATTASEADPDLNKQTKRENPDARAQGSPKAPNPESAAQPRPADTDCRPAKGPSKRPLTLQAAEAHRAASTHPGVTEGAQTMDRRNPESAAQPRPADTDCRPAKGPSKRPLPHEAAEARRASEARPGVTEGAQTLDLGSQRVLRYTFDQNWKPHEEHRARGMELGLTDREIIARAEDCRLKPIKQGFFNEDDHFYRELAWAKRDKEIERAKKEAYANRKDYELPGHDRTR